MMDEKRPPGAETRRADTPAGADPDHVQRPHIDSTDAAVPEGASNVVPLGRTLRRAIVVRRRGDLWQVRGASRYGYWSRPQFVERVLATEAEAEAVAAIFARCGLPIMRPRDGVAGSAGGAA